MTLAGKAAVAGIGATEFSKDSGRTELRLATEALADLELWCRGGADYGDELAFTLALRRAAAGAA